MPELQYAGAAGAERFLHELNAGVRDFSAAVFQECAFHSFDVPYVRGVSFDRSIFVRCTFRTGFDNCTFRHVKMWKCTFERLVTFCDFSHARFEIVRNIPCESYAFNVYDGAHFDRCIISRDDNVCLVVQLSFGDVYYFPTPAGWSLSIGGWVGSTLGELRDVIQGKSALVGVLDDSQSIAARAVLRAVHDLCDVHAQYHEYAVLALSEQWKFEGDSYGRN